MHHLTLVHVAHHNITNNTSLHNGTKECGRLTQRQLSLWNRTDAFLVWYKKPYSEADRQKFDMNL